MTTLSNAMTPQTAAIVERRAAISDIHIILCPELGDDNEPARLLESNVEAIPWLDSIQGPHNFALDAFILNCRSGNCWLRTEYPPVAERKGADDRVSG
jgi:hypothetical protein